MAAGPGRFLGSRRLPLQGSAPLRVSVESGQQWFYYTMLVGFRFCLVVTRKNLFANFPISKGPHVTRYQDHWAEVGSSHNV